MEKEKRKKVAPPPISFWPKIVEVFFVFVAEKFNGEKPTFDGSAPRDLKLIILALQQRAKDASVEWTEENALLRVRNFFERAYADPWLQQNFLLFNINRQKDKIFLNAKKTSNGTTTNIRGYGEKPIPTVRPKGSFGKL